MVHPAVAPGAAVTVGVPALGLRIQLANHTSVLQGLAECLRQQRGLMLARDSVAVVTLANR